VQPELNQGEPRADPRSNVFLTAILCAGPARDGVRIRNLSSHGALLEGASLPAEGAIVEIKRGSLTASGDIAWSREQHCGLRFHSTIDVARWIERAGPIGQQRIDAAIADFRREPSRPPSFAVLPVELKHPGFGSLSEEILAICERMANLPTLSIAVAEQILKIEAAARAIEATEKPGR
jgi:hypothetical protein